MSRAKLGLLELQLTGNISNVDQVRTIISDAGTAANNAHAFAATEDVSGLEDSLMASLDYIQKALVDLETILIPEIHSPKPSSDVKTFLTVRVVPLLDHVQYLAAEFEKRVNGGIGNVVTRQKTEFISFILASFLVGGGFVALIINLLERQRRSIRDIQNLARAVDESPGIVIILNTDGTIRYVNNRYTAVSGFTRDEVMDRPPDFLRDRQKHIQPDSILTRIKTNGGNWTGNFQTLRKNGESYWVRYAVSSILDKHGSPTGYLALGEDISDNMTAIQTLSEADKVSAIELLAAGVAHEFKNYLCGIIGNASMELDDLGQENAAGRTCQVLKDIIDIGERASELASSLLTFSRAPITHKENADLKSIVEDTLSLIDQELKIQSISVVSYLREVPRINIAVGRIQQLLLNLLINARDAIKRDGIITVGLCEKDDIIELNVGDTGHGISPATLPRIFDPFFSTKGVWGNDNAGGTGIGLSLCRNIAREHQGDLSAVSLEGAGTIFTLKIPVSSRVGESMNYSVQNTKGHITLIHSSDRQMYRSYFPQVINTDISLFYMDHTIPFNELMAAPGVVIFDARGRTEDYIHDIIRMYQQHDCSIHMIVSPDELVYFEHFGLNIAGIHSDLPDLQSLGSSKRPPQCVQDVVSLC